MNSSDSLSSERQIPAPTSTWMLHVGIGLIVIGTGLTMTNHPDGTVSTPILMGHRLPMICQIRKQMGFDCLTCGMTRSVVHLLQGRFEQSFTQHPLGWLFLSLIALQIPYGLQLRFLGDRAWRPSDLTLITCSVMTATALILVRFAA